MKIPEGYEFPPLTPKDKKALKRSMAAYRRGMKFALEYFWRGMADPYTRLAIIAAFGPSQLRKLARIAKKNVSIEQGKDEKMKTTLDALEWALMNNACAGPGEAIEWLEGLPKGTTLAEAWDQCQRSDWMLWALRKAGLCEDSPALHEFACRAAEGALKAEVAAGRSVDARSWAAIKVKRQWMQGEATNEQLAAAVAAAARAAAREAAREAAWEARAAAWLAARASAAEEAAEEAAREAAWLAAREAAWKAARASAAEEAARAEAAREAAWKAARAEQADLLRKLLGNPFLWSTRW
jgi:hypothetical protein